MNYLLNILTLNNGDGDDDDHQTYAAPAPDDK